MMKTILLLMLTVLVSGLSLTAHPTDEFEGILSITLTEQAQSKKPNTYTVDFFIHDEMLAVNIPGDKGRAILNMDSKEIYMIVEQGGNETIINVNMETVNKLGGVSSFLGSYGMESAVDEAGLTATGKSKKIEGQLCQQYVQKNEAYEVEVWVSNAFPYDFSHILAMFDLDKDLGLGERSMPMQGSAKNLKSGNVTEYVISVKEDDVDDSQFEVPTNLNQINMTQMIENMLKNNDAETVRKMLSEMFPEQK